MFPVIAIKKGKSKPKADFLAFQYVLEKFSLVFSKKKRNFRNFCKR